MESFQGCADLTFVGILEKLKTVPMDGRTAESLYLPGYERMLKYFDQQPLSEDTDEEREFKAQLVGSWLPRCFRTYGPTPGKEVFDSFDPFSDEGAANVIRVVEWMGSLAGATKVLHFDDPHNCPIYDRVIADTIGEEYSVKGYLTFTARLHRPIARAFYFERSEALEEIVRIVHIGQVKPTAMRAVELALYLIGLEIKRTTAESEG